MSPSKLLLILASCVVAASADPRCPFPGIGTNSQLSLKNRTITWADRTAFDPDTKLRFTCLHRLHALPKVDSVVCQSNGQWNKPLPQCGTLVYNSQDNLNASIYQFDSEKNESTLVTWGRRCSSISLTSQFVIDTEFNETISYVNLRTCPDDDAPYQFTINDIQCTSMSDNSDRNKMYECGESGSGNVVGQLRFNFPDGQVKLKKLKIYTTGGNHCGLPPVPVDGDIVGQVMAGQTAVSFTCNPPTELDGPGSSSCHPPSGRWSSLPKCVHSTPAVLRTVLIITTVIFILLAGLVLLCQIRFFSIMATRKPASKSNMDVHRPQYDV